MATTCNDCRYYDLSTEVELAGAVYHPCKRNAPVQMHNSYNELGTWPIVLPQTPVCGEYKRRQNNGPR